MKTRNASFPLYLMGLCTMTLFLLLSCSDNEEWRPSDGDLDIKEEMPTTDEIETRLTRDVAVLGSNFDKVTQKVLDRVTGMRHLLDPLNTTAIPETVELIFIDETAMLTMERPTVMALKEAFQRGAIMYMDKPNGFAAALFTIAMYDDLDKFLQSDTRAAAMTRAGEDVIHPYDFFAMRNDQSHLEAARLFDKQPIERTDVNEETGETSTVTITPSEPTDYEYGRFAECVAGWAEETLNPSAGTRAEASSNPFAQKKLTKIVPCLLDFSTPINRQNTVTLPAELTFWVTPLYSFEDDQDYYHVVMEEYFNGLDAYKGCFWDVTQHDFSVLKNNTDKQFWGLCKGGYTYCGPDVYVRWSDSHPLLRQEDLEPDAEGKTSLHQTITGWNVNASIGYSDGVEGSLTASYTSQEKVTTLDKEIKINSLKWNQPAKQLGSAANWMIWDYEINSKGMQGAGISGLLSESLLCCRQVKTRQAWSWYVGNTHPGEARPDSLQFSVYVDFPAYYAVMEPMKYKRSSHRVSLNKEPNKPIVVNLPLPNRYRESYAIGVYPELESKAEREEWNDDILKSLKNYSDFADCCAISGICSTHKTALDDKVKAQWHKGINQVVKAPTLSFKGISRDYFVRMTDSEGNYIGDILQIRQSDGKVVRVSPTE